MSSVGFVVLGGFGCTLGVFWWFFGYFGGFVCVFCDFGWCWAIFDFFL